MLVSDEVVVQCSMLLLPVELLSFEASPDQGEVLCKWVTASELNNDYFTVKRSRDNVSWDAVGEVDGAGTSLETNAYQFRDKDPHGGPSYYRVKQTDYNGDYSYSWVRAVAFDQALSGYMFPNPNQGVFSLSSVPEGAGLRITDARGREIAFAVFGGNSIDLLDAPPGCYFLELTGNEGQVLLRERCLVEQ